MPVSCWMRRSGQPSRPSAMTCCRFSSLKTLLTSMEGTPSVVLNVLPISIGRFSAVPHWPLLGVPRGDYLRFRYLMRKIVGKRLTFDQLTGKTGKDETPAEV